MNEQSQHMQMDKKIERLNKIYISTFEYIKKNSSKKDPKFQEIKDCCVSLKDFSNNFSTYEQIRTYSLILSTPPQSCNNKGIEKNPPKLVILDDMELSSFKYIEIWKKLLSGQRVISYYSTSSGIINWNYKIPCVVLTNNLLIVMRIFQNEELRKYAIFQEIVNTRNDFNEIEIDFSNEIMQYLLKEELINTNI